MFSDNNKKVSTWLYKYRIWSKLNGKYLSDKGDKGIKLPIIHTYIYYCLNGDPKTLLDEGSRELALNRYMVKTFPQIRVTCYNSYNPK